MVESASQITVQVARHGPISEQDRNHAAHKLARLVDRVGRHVLFARAELSWHANPARQHRAEAKAELDLGGEVVRAQMAAPTLTEAVDLLIDRLADKVVHRSQRRRVTTSRHGRTRHQRDQSAGVAPRRPTIPAGQATSAPDDRRVVSHQTYAGGLTLDEAIGDMAAGDLDFYLFVDSDCGIDSLLSHPDNRTELQRLALAPPPTSTDVDVVDRPVPVLSVAVALERLEAGGESFLFFEEETTARGAVVYHRWDGDTGLLTTVPPPDPLQWAGGASPGQASSP